MKATHAYQVVEGGDWTFCSTARPKEIKAFRVVTAKKALKEIAAKSMEDLRKRINNSIIRYPGRVPASKRPEGTPEKGFHLKKGNVTSDDQSTKPKSKKTTNVKSSKA